jgi:hypothetical protein
VKNIDWTAYFDKLLSIVIRIQGMKKKFLPCPIPFAIRLSYGA